MANSKKYKISLFVLLLFAFIVSNAQDIQEQIEFKIDNDKFVFQDKYYTSGFFISYKMLLTKDFIFSKKSDNKLQLNFAIGNETYTPKNISSFNINDFDRPYAGWLFGKFEIGKIKQNSALFIAIETGITGEESLAGKLQTAFHDFLDIENPKWIEEIAFKWLVNVKAKYILDWKLGKHSALQYASIASLGSKDVFAENGLSYFFGKFNPLQNSSRHGIIDETDSKEFYGLIGLGYKYVVHNALIEGSLFKEDKLFTTDAIKHLAKIKMGCVYKTKRNTFSLIYNYNSKETLKSTSHIFGSFTYARKF